MDKQIIALGIIGILVTIGISGCLENKEDNGSIAPLSGKVTVTTNKSEYTQNETIKILIQNNMNYTVNLLIPFYTIEKNDDNNWIEMRRSIYPCEEQCRIGEMFPYLPIEPFGFIEYEWNQKETWCSDETGNCSPTISASVTSGTYRIKCEFEENETKFFIYSNEFTIKEQETYLKCEPTVVVTGINYSSNPDDVPYDEAHTRFKENYTANDLSIEFRNTIIQNMAEQAELLGENSSILYEAIKVTYDDWEERPFMIPCYAEKALYLDDPVWIIAFNRCNGFIGDIGHFDIFYVSIQTLETQWYTGCNSSSVVYWFGCD